MKAFKRLLLLGTAGLIFSSLAVYAQDPSEEVIATQGYLHLRTRPVVYLCEDEITDLVQVCLALSKCPLWAPQQEQEGETGRYHHA